MPKVINYTNNNRINSTGDLLEYYVKDSFCSAASNFENSLDKRNEYQTIFSYLGNGNNPPDFIVKHGVAVEVKKIEGLNANGIALNSSFPKDYLYNDDIRINKSCKECEDEFGGWAKKEIIYAVGNVKEKKLHNLWFVYGDCYCADKMTYERISETIRDGVSSIPGVEFGKTKELGRVNKVDPLGITYLRVRGMWGIEHPSSVFKNLLNKDSTQPNIYVLMKKDTYLTMENKPDLKEFVDKGKLKISDVKIPNPNNPAKDLEAILYNGILD